MKQMLFQKKVDEVDGELPPEVETMLIETDSAMSPMKLRLTVTQKKVVKPY